jgi:hypothetical protein
MLNGSNGHILLNNGPLATVSWLAYLDARLEQRLLAPSPLSYTAKERVEREQDTLLDAHVKQEDEKKYRCAVPKCGKLFMAPDFVRKHIRLKHPDLIEEATHKARPHWSPTPSSSSPYISSAHRGHVSRCSW